LPQGKEAATMLAIHFLRSKKLLSIMYALSWPLARKAHCKLGGADDELRAKMKVLNHIF